METSGTTMTHKELMEREAGHPKLTERDAELCDSFDEAMDLYFEGFNPPAKIEKIKIEEFSKSAARIREYYRKRNQEVTP